MITKSDFIQGLALLMIYTELGFSTEYGGLLMICLTLIGATIVKRNERHER